MSHIYLKVESVVTGAVVPISTGYADSDVVDGEVLASGDLILIAFDGGSTDNGVYTVQGSGSPVRAPEADADADMPHSLVIVAGGTTYGNTIWRCVNDTITLGTTAIEFAQLAKSVTDPFTLAAACLSLI